MASRKRSSSVVPKALLCAFAACAPTYARGCSTETRGVETHGAIVVRRYAKPYQAAKGKRFLEWCEIDVNGKPVTSSSGSRVAQGCDASASPGVEAVSYAWQGEQGTTDATLLEVVAGKSVEHPLHGGGSDGGWLAGGKLYVSGGEVFESRAPHAQRLSPERFVADGRGSRRERARGAQRV